MNVSSHALESDINRLTARMTLLEQKFETLRGEPSAPASLPVDKSTAADYGQDTSPTVGDDDSDDEASADPMNNLTQHQVRELVVAFDEYLRWKDSPNPTMSQHMQTYIERDALRRLQDAMRPMERVVQAIE
jgi:hypothetical protein